MSKTTPTYEQMEALLRAPFKTAKVVRAIHAFGSDLEVGRTVLAKPYHNDPDGWVSIRFTDESGELHEFTESDDRIEYVDEKITAQKKETKTLLLSITIAVMTLQPTDDSRPLDYSQQETLRSLDIQIWDLIQDLEDTA